MPNIFASLMSRGANKQLRAFEKIVAQVNERESVYKTMDDGELQSQTQLFKERLEKGASLDDLLPDAFAVVREASSRTLGMRHFDVQIIGGIALHRGMIAEMKTGEGKTLVSTLAGYLNALAGNGVHIVTVNDYLAKRDSEWMGRIYRYLGMNVGLIQNGMLPALKQPAYNADVTYGTNSEFGFDYLRDNMVMRADQRAQRGHHFAIVDEVDSILIDEARTPLIISGAGTKSAGTYKDFARAVRGLVRGEEAIADPLTGEKPEPTGDYVMDEAKRTITVTDRGLKKVERALNIDDIYADMSGQLVNHLQQALKAQYMFHRDKDYVVMDGEVKIVDEFTGRIMEGRRWSEGLHQAVEAKEGVSIREENQTIATITLQNYFRLYEKLSGMTGTAVTEDTEFREIYHLPVQAIPPNKPVIRKDHDDLIYQTVDIKFAAVADEVERRHANGQPCLVGTVSIESSERLSRTLSKRGIHHEVLNAKFHEREAQIVAQAGREGAVTIATNMAGRGTDILLGGNPEEMAKESLREQGFNLEEVSDAQLAAATEVAKKVCEVEREHVIAAGGLCVIGTERHESRRIDNQLRGRSGRQGDPGETQFYLSLEDDLLRLFGGPRMDKISALMARGNVSNEPIQHRLVTKAVETAQRKVEEVNYAMRKNVLDYDDVMNKQRQVIYEERNKILDGKDLVEHVSEVTESTINRVMAEFCPAEAEPETWDLDGLRNWIEQLTGETHIPVEKEETDAEELEEKVTEFVMGCYQRKAEVLGDEILKALSVQVMLRVIDTRWMSYLQDMDYLRTGIGLRGYGQRDPLVEYKSEAYAAFSELVNTMYEDFLRTILRLQVRQAPASVSQEEPESLRGAHFSGPAEVDGDRGRQAAVRYAPKHAAPNPHSDAKPMPYRKNQDPYAGVGRNDPCPCGSGKKFKNCHGKNR